MRVAMALYKTDNSGEARAIALTKSKDKRGRHCLMISKSKLQTSLAMRIAELKLEVVELL